MVRLDNQDPEAYARFVVEHMFESGRGGSPHFALARAPLREEIRTNLVTRLTKGLDEPLWGRAWVLVGPDDRRMLGHLELRGGRVPAEMHRTTLGMGLLRAHTGRGLGARLVEEAIRWARDEARLEWIDLGVFASNAPARKLYQRMGFVEIGTKEDAFRLDSGVAVDDITMVLKLR
jgi:GNAT superfamily N-acetyltransferase